MKFETCITASPTFKEMQKIWPTLKSKIELNLQGFKDIWENGSEEDIFTELVFCLFTPQSKAKSCWAAVNKLSSKGLLLNGTKKQIADEISTVRFRNNKASYVVTAREQFLKNGKLSLKPTISGCSNILDARDWLAENVKGMGYKEASHFLRNIGFGEKLAILDRHILRNLKEMKVINTIPQTLSKNNYLAIEKKISELSKVIMIPMNHIDIILWSKETGEIFK